jgi:hypothetical protein
LEKKKTIVISAINLRSGGTLTVLRDCLTYISQSEIAKKYRVIALVHKRELADYSDIEYMEFPRSSKHWVYRLFYEYIYFYTLSCKLKPYLWLSLHDMTPNVKTEKQAVYMHNPSIVNKIKRTDFRFGKTYVLFSLLYKFLYKINIRKNDYCIVQQSWFKNVCSQKLGVPEIRFIIARPNVNNFEVRLESFDRKPCKNFFYPSLSRPFKNFETVCKAADILSNRGVNDFQVVITINGTENSYSKWIKSQYKDNPNIIFAGLLNKEEMHKQYEKTDCLLFPSRLETWGLPISEFVPFNRPMIIADELYAHETSEGASAVAYYETNNATALADLMEEAIIGHWTNFAPQGRMTLSPPFARNYDELFKILLTEGE